MMNEAELLDPYEEIRSDLKKTALAYYFIEVISKITQEGEKNEDLYEFIQDYLFMLKTDVKYKKLRFDFIYNVLVLMGYWPKDKTLINHDEVLENILERQINSKRVGEKLLH